MILTNNENRIGIFAFFDKDGIVDDYIPTLIAGVRAYCKQMIIVVNGTLTAEGVKKLSPLGTILYRENEGFDISGYKHGYFHLLASGALDACDELLFFNQTIFGPLFSLDPLFENANAANCDFWGLTLHPEADHDFFGDGNLTHAPAHLQSYFFAARASLLHTNDFEQYWRNLPVIASYEDAVSKHEVRFTDHFIKRGYHSYTAIDTTDNEPFSNYSLMDFPLWVIEEKNCPFCKRKSFILQTYIHQNLTSEWGCNALYHFIKDHTSYDPALIVENITRTAQPIHLFSALQYIEVANTPRAPHCSTVVVLHITKELPAFFAQLLHAIQQASHCIVILPTHFACPDAVHALHAHVLHSDSPVFPLLFSSLWQEIQSYDRILFLDTNCDYATLCNNWCALCDFETNERLFEQDENLALLTPLPYLQGNFMLPNWAPQLDALQAWLHPAFPHYKLTEQPCPDMPAMFYGKTNILAPLNGLDWCHAPTALFDTEKPLAATLPMLATHCAGKLSCIVTAAHGHQLLFSLYDYIQQVNAIFATPKIHRRDLVLFRMQGIYDFFQKYRYALHLDEFTHPNTSFKKKLWAILQILQSKTTTPDAATRPQDE